MNKVLVIEDDPAIRCGLEDSLTFEGYSVASALDAETGYDVLRGQQPDIILLDLMLPGRNGIEFCRSVRAEGIQIPILMLTAKGLEADRIRGLDTGADDYVAKPFSIGELMARIRALLRRTQLQRDGAQHVRFGEADIDFIHFEARRAGKRVEMTRKEFALLKLFASRNGHVFTREELLDEVWGLDIYPVSRTVDSHVAGLRAKLEIDPARPRHIKTVYGVGYKFIRDGESCD